MLHRHTHRAALLAAGVPAAVAAGQCEPAWTSTFQANGLDVPPTSLVGFSDGAGPAVFAAGFFGSAGGVPVNGLARWSGTSWTAADSGLPGLPFGLAVLDQGAGPALHVSTRVIGVGYPLARWDGAAWTQIGAMCPPSAPFTLYPTRPVVFDDGATGPRIYLGTTDSSTFFGDTGSVRRLDGSAWTLITPDANTSILDLAVFDPGAGPRLYAAGYRANLSQPFAGFVGTWDGSVWTTLTTPPASAAIAGPIVAALRPHTRDGRPALYAAGQFTSIGGVPALHVASWDGASWAALGAGLGPAPDDSWASALEVHDDGGGPSLYVGGRFSTAGGLIANGVARWDSQSWSALDTGVAGAGYVRVAALGSAGAVGGLHVGGQFDTAGAMPSINVARWACRCYADCNGSSALEVADFGCFQTRFVAGASYADCNRDGALTVADFGCFQTGFAAGCP